LTRVKGVDPDPQLGFGVWPAPPAGIGERIQRGDAEPSTKPVRAERFAGESECGTAAHPARRSPSRYRARTAEGVANRLDRRRAGAGDAVVELHPGEEDANHCPLDGNAVALG